MSQLQTKFVYGKDKQMHFLTGMVGGFTVAIGVHFKGGSPVWQIGSGVGLGVVSGVGKEIYDYKHPGSHTADVWDAVFTILGALVGALLAQLWRF